MKKFVSLLLTASFILSLSTTAFAMETTIEKSDNSTIDFCQRSISILTNKEQIPTDLTIKYVSDGNGNRYLVAETGDIGYYIFDETTGKCMEFSETATSPYANMCGNLYYFGPMHYYSLNSENKLQHTISDNYAVPDTELLFTASEKMHQAVVTDVAPSANNSTVALASTAPLLEERYIVNKNFIINANCPENSTGICGYVAAALVLNFWDETYPSKDIIPSELLGSNRDLNSLVDKLLSYGYTEDTWGPTIANALTDYCEEYNIDAGILKNANDPVDDPTGATRAHAVACFGYQTYGTPNVVESVYYAVHYGWSSATEFNNVWINSFLIGSNTKFRPSV